MIIFTNNDYLAFMKAILFSDEVRALNFIEKGIDCNYQDSIGNTPLILASKADSVVLIKALVLAGAKLELTNQLNETPLMEAIDLGKLNAAKYLVSIGANVNTKDYFGNSLLTRAIRNKNFATFLFLLEYGIEATIKDKLDIMENETLSLIFQSIEEKKHISEKIHPNKINSSHKIKL